MKRERLSYFLISLFCVFTVFSFGILITYSISHNDVTKVSGAVSEMNEWDYTYQDPNSGETITGHMTSPDEVLTDGSVSIIYKATIPENIFDGQYLCVHTGRSFDLYINRELRHSFDKENVGLPGGAAKSFYTFIEIDEKDAGATLEFVRATPPSGVDTFRSILAGDGQAITYKIVSEGLVYYAGVLILFAISAMGVTVGLILRLIKRRNANLLFVSLGSLLVSAWLILDGNLYQFMFHNLYVDGTVSYMVSVLVPFPFMLYVDRLQRERYHRWHMALEAVDLVYFMIVLGLIFGAKQNLVDYLVQFMIPLGAMFFVEAAIIVFDIVKKRTRAYRSMLYGLAVFIGLSCLELIMINLSDNRIDGFWILVGMYAVGIAAILQQVHESSFLMLTIKEQKEQIKTTTKKARTDDLTGINNSRYMHEVVSDMLGNGMSGAFIMIDLDNFKTVNDTYGHAVGDEALVTFARILKRTFRIDDVVCRMGGDEFAVFMPGEVTKELLEEKILLLNEKFGLLAESSEYGRVIHVSAGVSFAPKDGKTIDELYRRADKAMYHVKNNGKNGIHFS